MAEVLYHEHTNSKLNLAMTHGRVGAISAWFHEDSHTARIYPHYRASGGFVAPFLTPEIPWDFRLENVKSINTSGHKFGLVYPVCTMSAACQ